MVTTWNVDEWEGCYPSNWKGVIIPEAIAHPAKFSSRLIRRIYEHIVAEKWVEPGDTILDPFGGVALGALDALRVGLRWRGCELEPRFAELGNGNIFHWNLKFRQMPKWSGDAVLYQGDSRHLLDVLSGRAQGAISSPPYADTDTNHHRNGLLEDGNKPYERPYMDGRQDDYGSTPGQLGGMKAEGFQIALSSPPYAEARIGQESGQEHCGRGDQYGGTDGQLGSMGANKFDSAVSSPPYNLPMSQDHNGKRGGARGTTPSENGAFVKYGNTEGQLEGLPMSEEGFTAAVSSPPYKNAVEGGGLNVNRPATFRGVLKDGSLSMGDSDGNLSAMNDTNFQASISSPPFRQSEGGTPEPKPGGVIDERLYARHAAGNSAAEGYGASNGQLANMREGDFQSVITSKNTIGSRSIITPVKESGQWTHAKTAEFKSQEEVDGAESVTENITVKNSRGKRNQTASEKKSQKQDTTNHLLKTGESYIVDGQEEGTGGGVSLGLSKDEPLLNETITNVKNAEGQEESRYTINEARRRQAESGTTASKISKPSVYPAISKSTDEQNTTQFVQCVENITLEVRYELAAQINAEERLNLEPRENITQPDPNDFWLASRQIVEQVYQALEPGGHAVWVCKRFVKDKKIVEFSDQWRQLCEAVGFKTIHWHKAMLVRRKGTSINFEGEHVEHKSESKSFFRRLAESKGSPRIDWEDVLCMVKE